MRFDIVVADPPWEFADNLPGETRGSAKQYDVLDVDALAALRVGQRLAFDEGVLALWCPSALILQGVGARICKAWGYVPKQIVTWCKTTLDGERPRLAMGRLFRGGTEHAIIAVRGDKPSAIYRQIEDRGIPAWFTAPAMPHSQKPEKLQDRIERLLPGRRNLELFARRDRPGWICKGNQCPSSEGQDVRVSLSVLEAMP